jgi:hypothetical protein
MRRKVDVSSHVDDELRAFWSQNNGGLFKKGDLMELRDKAILHYMRCTKKHGQYTHTQNKPKDEIFILKGRVFNHFLERYEELPYSVPEKDVILAIKVVTGNKDDRAAKADLDMLIGNNHFSREKSKKIRLNAAVEVPQITVSPLSSLKPDRRGGE